MLIDNSEIDNFAIRYLSQLEEALNHIDLGPVKEATQKIRSCQGTVWLIGNGGSAALASHMATDLQLAGVRAQSLTDVSAITTYANDLGYTQSFREQLRLLARAGDILIALSGSGNSTNVTWATQYAQGNGIFVIGISGFDGGELMGLCDLHLHAPASHMGQAQDLEHVMLHIICYWLMEGRKG